MLAFTSRKHQTNTNEPKFKFSEMRLLVLTVQAKLPEASTHKFFSLYSFVQQTSLSTENIQAELATRNTNRLFSGKTCKS